MDFTEVPVTNERKSKKKKNKKAGNKRMSEAENGESAVVEKKSEEKMENGESSAAFPPTFSVSEIKNKQRRHMMFMKLKQEKRKQKLQLRKKKKKERAALGDKAPPKEVPKTIENQRVFDETTCVARNFTYLMVINEDRLVPSILKNVNIRGQKAY
uniref:Ribosome production factor 1 homolog n=1 Tax=Oryzias sinensis TaxID=183150 RepID=A0A8C7X0J3_9TELE